MSEENEKGEDKPKSSDEFEFYFAFTKPLVLDLPSSEDRAIAAAWVQKLEAEPESEEGKEQRLNYLKLLLFVLQRGRLSGIFKKQPPAGPLQPFPQGFSILDMGNWMLDQDDSQPCGAGDARSVPYTMELSNDLREFVAAQEIPNFGIQMYYAWSSDDPIHKWTSFDEEKFPQFILEKIRQLKEVRSDEKNLRQTAGMGKRIFDMAFQDKLLKKKVKSPQEIEKSQGRSYHTYMGLVGRMGKFNEKCNDDQEKSLRPDQRKGKHPGKKNTAGRCAGNGGQGQDAGMSNLPEAFRNLGIDFAELESYFRPCYCPDNEPPGGPQPVGDQRSPNRPMRFTVRADVHNAECPDPVTNPTTSRAGPGGQLLESLYTVSQPQQQVKNRTWRSRSGSPNRPGVNPLPGDALRRQNAVCICTAPCNCPCPRGTVTKPGPSGIAAENQCVNPPNPPATFTKAYDRYGGRGPGNYLTSFKAPETFTPVTSRPDVTPTGGRTDVGTALRWKVPEVIHCYDRQNPDPALTEKLDKQWITTASGGYRYLDSNYKRYLSRSQLIESGSQLRSRKELFTPQAESTPVEANENCDGDGEQGGSPPLEAHPACEYSPENEPGPTAQRSFCQQQYQVPYSEIEGESPPPRRCPERGPADTYQVKRNINRPCSPSQTVTKPKNSSCFHTNPFAVQGNTGRLADMNTVLQGLKQMTETYGSKCEPAAVQRSPVGDPACYPGNDPNRTQTKSRPQPALKDGGQFQTCRNDLAPMRNARPLQRRFYSPPARPTQSYSSFLDRGYLSLPNADIAQDTSLRSGAGTNPAGDECYQLDQQNFDECEADNEQEEDCDGESSESADECPPPPQCSPKEVRYKPTGPIREPLQQPTFGTPYPKKRCEEGKSDFWAPTGSAGAPPPEDCRTNMAGTADPCPQTVSRPDPCPQTVSRPDPCPQTVSRPDPCPQTVSRPDPCPQTVSRPDPCPQPCPPPCPQPCPPTCPPPCPPQNSSSSGSRNANAVNWTPPAYSPPDQQGGTTSNRACSPTEMSWTPQNTQRTVIERSQRMQPGAGCPEEQVNWAQAEVLPQRPAPTPTGPSCPDGQISWSYPRGVRSLRPARMPTGLQEQASPMPQGGSCVRGSYSPQAISPELQFAQECDNGMQNIENTLVPQGQGYSQQGLGHPGYDVTPFVGEGCEHTESYDMTLRDPHCYSRIFVLKNSQEARYSSPKMAERSSEFHKTGRQTEGCAPGEREDMSLSPIYFMPEIYNQRSQTGNKYFDNSANASYPLQRTHSTLIRDECDMNTHLEDEFCSDLSGIQQE